MARANTRNSNSDLAHERNRIMGQLAFARAVINTSATGQFFNAQRNYEADLRLERLKANALERLVALENQLWLEYDKEMTRNTFKPKIRSFIK